MNSLVIFFSLTINGFVPQLRDVKTVCHALRVGQEFRTGRIERRPHVDAIALHRLTLRGRQAFQTGARGILILALGDREHLRALGIAQIGEDRHIHFVPFLQADLVHADAGDDPAGIDLARFAQLVLDDERDHLGRDAVATRGLFHGGKREHAQHLLFEAKGVLGVLALERWNDMLPRMATLAAKDDDFVDPVAGHAEHIDVAREAGDVENLVGVVCLVAALLALVNVGPFPGDLEEIQGPDPAMMGDVDPVGHIDVDSDFWHGQSLT